MNKTTKELVLQSIIAAVYVAITFVFQSMSFMPQQFRVSEFMLILVLIHPKNALGIILGTLLANVFSSVGAVDIVVGTFATYLSLKLMVRVQLKWLKYLMPSIINGIIIGIMLYAVLD
ncbi:MAG: QueT transporter family protein, partial [Erysipelothrix sp.]|nr:QueT transporter family protein [Erysipelothrix sp.]